MKQYTLESFKQENPNSRYISEETVKRVNQYIREIEDDRSNTVPTYGDRVEYTNKYGNYSLSNVNPADGFTDEGQINLCEGGNGGHYCKHSISTAGGPWANIDAMNFELIGKAEATFWCWGNFGACAGGGVYFRTEVNLWKCDVNEQRFSTRYNDRFYVYKHDKNEYGYIYTVTRGATSHSAYRNKEDFEAWLVTYRGIIERQATESNGVLSMVAWTYKEDLRHMTPQDIFEASKGIEDTQLWNGGIRRVKRVYDDEAKTVTTYLCRELPELDYKTTKQYMAARK